MVLVYKKLVLLNPRQLKKSLKESNASYNALSKLRTKMMTNAAGKEEGENADAVALVRVVERLMKDRLKEQAPTVRRRVAGTGTAVTEELTYGDTETNRKAERVGKTYTRVRYEGAEYVEEQQKLMRNCAKRLKPATKRAENAWMQAVKKARTELSAEGLVIIRSDAKMTDPTDPGQVLGNKVYHLAKEHLATAKAAAAAAKEVDAPAPVAMEGTEETA